MKSCTSTRRPACAPPPKICICGSGSNVAADPSDGIRTAATPCAAAAACAAAIDTASGGVRAERGPSFRCRRARSGRAVEARAWSSAGVAYGARAAISPVDIASLPAARRVRRTRADPSRSSSASRVPFDAPAGTIARPIAPSFSVTSASTVGRPRLVPDAPREEAQRIVVLIARGSFWPNGRVPIEGLPTGCANSSRAAFCRTCSRCLSSVTLLHRGLAVDPCEEAAQAARRPRAVRVRLGGLPVHGTPGSTRPARRTTRGMPASQPPASTGT